MLKPWSLKHYRLLVSFIVIVLSCLVLQLSSLVFGIFLSFLALPFLSCLLSRLVSVFSCLVLFDLLRSCLLLSYRVDIVSCFVLFCLALSVLALL